MVFWSGTDDKCCDKLGGGDFSVSIVANRKKKLLGRVDIYKPFRVTISGIDIVVEDTVSFVIPQSIKDEVEEKVDTRFGGLWKNRSRSVDREDYTKDNLYERQLSNLRKWDYLSGRWVAWNRETMNWEKEVLEDKDVEVYDGEWDAKRQEVVLADGDTFCPISDTRKFGDVPPEEVFILCKGDTVVSCGVCVYRKECDEFMARAEGIPL